MPANFAEALKLAKEELVYKEGQRDPPMNTMALYALADYAEDPAHRSQILQFVQGAFDALREDAKKKRPGSVGLINDMMFGAVGRLAGLIGAPELAPLLYQEFAFAADENRNYEMNLEAGTLAISLSLLGYTGPMDLFDQFFDSFEGTYAGEEFVLKVRYALWVIKKDHQQPIQYLKNPLEVVIMNGYKVKLENANRSLGFVAAALADLDAKEGAPILQEMRPKLVNPVAAQVFREAITRLQKQTQPPLPSDRMIWMFGKYSATEIALGQESDDVFIARAQDQTKNKELGRATEVDESAKRDT